MGEFYISNSSFSWNWNYQTKQPELRFQVYYEEHYTCLYVYYSIYDFETGELLCRRIQTFNQQQIQLLTLEDAKEKGLLEAFETWQKQQRLPFLFLTLPEAPPFCECCGICIEERVFTEKMGTLLGSSLFESSMCVCCRFNLSEQTLDAFLRRTHGFWKVRAVKKKYAYTYSLLCETIRLTKWGRGKMTQ